LLLYAIRILKKILLTEGRHF